MEFYSWLWSPTPSCQWIPATASYQHNRRFSGSVPVWPRVCPRGRDGSSVWEWWSVDPLPWRCHLQPQTHTHIHTAIHRGIHIDSKFFTRWGSNSVHLIISSANINKLLQYHSLTGIQLLVHVITFLQTPVMKAAISTSHVPQVLPLQQLSPVLCHSSLEHWLALWYTTVL